jgi:hypothetical protein
MPINFARQNMGTGTGEMRVARSCYLIAMSHARASGTRGRIDNSAKIDIRLLFRERKAAFGVESAGKIDKGTIRGKRKGSVCG